MRFMSEGLVADITSRFRRANPDPQTSQSTEVQPNSNDKGDLPLGADYGTWEWYAHQVALLRARKDLYMEYEEMDAECPEFSSAMDILADNATRGDTDGDAALHIRSGNPRATQILTDLRERIGLEYGSWTLARDIAKYGERAEEIIVVKNPTGRMEIQRLKSLPTQYIAPQIDEWGRWENPAFTQVNDAGEKVAEFERWQMALFANTKSRTDVMGTSMGYAARKPFKQLRMMEDAVVIGRLTRAHNRLAYMVDTGELTPQEAQAHLNKVKATLRQRRLVDSRSGKMDLKFNPLSVQDDVFVATHKESKADVKVLQGDLTVGNLNDLEYFLQKIITAVHVPKAYLAYEKDIKTKGVISSQDIQFARAVRRIQNVMAQGFRQIFDLELMLRGVDPKAVQYVINLPIISIEDDLRVWQTEQLKMLTAGMFKETFWPDDEWIFKNYLGYDDERTAKLMKGQSKPDKFNGLFKPPAPAGGANKGAAPNRTRRNSKEWMEVAARIAQLPADEFKQLHDTVENLRVITDIDLTRIEWEETE